MHPSDPAVREILEHSMVARLATVSRSGRPHVNPIYFVLAGDRVQLGTSGDTLAARNVATNPAVQVLFEIESDPADRRILRIEGVAAVRTEPDTLRAYKRQDARKYFGSLRAAWMSLTHVRQLRMTRQYLSRSGQGAGHCVIEVEPISVEIIDGLNRRT